MKIKVLFFAAAIFAAFGFINLQAQTIPTIQADTVFQGFPQGGSVSGIVFCPTGETVIVIHNISVSMEPEKYIVKPVEIDIKTKKIVREFEEITNAVTEGNELFFYAEKNMIGCNARSSDLNGSKNFYGLVIWDYNTGKIINSKQPGIISNGNQFYTQVRDINKHKQYFCRYDINTLIIIDSVEFDQGWFQGSQTRFSAGFGMIPNSNKVIIGANSKSRSNLYVLDFDTKKYTEILIPFEKGQDSSEIINIKVSETGKYFLVTIDLPFDYTAYMVYNQELKFVFKETINHINKTFNNPSRPATWWWPYFIHDDYLLTLARAWNASEKEDYFYSDFYSITDKTINQRVQFEEGGFIDYFNNDIVISNYAGKLGLLHLDALPVQENKINPIEKTAEFLNGILTINFEIAEKADIEIIDYRGNMIYTMKDIVLQAGKNLLNIDYPLTNGVYFAVVKTLHGDFPYKFLVSR